MITPGYTSVWTLAKKAARQLGHPVLTSEHLFYACLRLHNQRYWDLARRLPVTAKSVWAHLKESPPFSEPSEDFGTVKLGVSAKAALDRAEIEAGNQDHPIMGTNGLMRALLEEKDGPVHSLLEAVQSTTCKSTHEDAN